MTPVRPAGGEEASMQEESDGRMYYRSMKNALSAIANQHGFASEEITVRAGPLSTEEAIGSPEDHDYPLIRGRERLMQAEFRGSAGQAFTDMYGEFKGKLIDVLELEPSDNFRRAVFVAALNAVLRHTGIADKTIHCKDDAPRRCARKLVEHISQEHGSPRIAMIGLQPRMVEALAGAFEVRVTDMDPDNIGSEKAGIAVEPAENWQACMDWADIAVITGSTVVNNTIGQFRTSKPALYYGTTIAGPARILGLAHFCHCGS
jgi:hypothetical protein